MPHAHNENDQHNSASGARDLPPLSSNDLGALGPFKACHKYASARAVAMTVVGVVICAVGIPAFIYWLTVFPPGQLSDSELAFRAIPAAILIGAATGAVVMLRRLKWRIDLFENGLVFSRAVNAVVLWPDVEKLHVSVKYPLMFLQFCTKDGGKYYADTGFRDYPTLSDYIRGKVCRALVASLSPRLDRGEEIDFGGLFLSAIGLRYGKQAILWQHVAWIKFVWERYERAGGMHEDYATIKVFRRQGASVEEYCSMRIEHFVNFDAFAVLYARYARAAIYNLHELPETKQLHDKLAAETV